MVLNEMLAPIDPFWAGDRSITLFRWDGGSCFHTSSPFTKGVWRVTLVRHDPQGNDGKAVEHSW
ncbi:hypothetical protein NBRC3280_2700 [Acetobacter pasteurianus NBRC 3280]|uniref:Uncharacterized protein n=2 Tax=Acetobacter TaxID=434 RepID=A0A1Y0V1C2_9PROT|nr:hypothetical protein S101447_02943 [Acetobacter ascendens]GCD60123.1 hypothetical protein NBRC3277_2698 [Acetobacter pasteurianus NBRC 3277]GCD63659.1 hypothetical protein NBRC3278_2752 [Acetobacter pasteurianus NBRC 3278]GCD70065.1 hypothetical protein NBRC3280_2700 [Acetobacter pasteurianus NBRC 3280]GCD75308.1 hypothetical protein NBRC3299_1600 [Acetobacter pasteurianus NBRC 3299]